MKRNRAMRDAAFRTPDSFLLLLGNIGAQAVRDVQYGIYLGSLDSETWTATGNGPESAQTAGGDKHDHLNAARWLRSAEAILLCDLINQITGRDLMSPHRMIKQAKVPFDPDNSRGFTVAWELASPEQRAAWETKRRAYLQAA